MTDGANRPEPQIANALQALAERMAGANMRGQWQNETNRGESASWDGDTMLPVGRGKPWLWPFADAHACLQDAASALPESMTARRSVLFNNPGLQRGTVATINMGIQMILPGEVAWAHRHSISALRFVIKGDPTLVTAVDGTGCPMETGDLILTPGGTWHDHYNGSGQPLMWLDVLDGPVMSAFNQTVFQNYGERRQPVRNRAERADDGDDNRLRYPWATVFANLSARDSKMTDPHDGHVYEYRDTQTGRHPMRTLGCRMHRFPSGFSGISRRNRTNSVFHAFRGGGSAEIDGTMLEWKEGDCFAIPGWCRRKFKVSTQTDAYIFEVNDEPLLENLGLLDGELPDRIRRVEEEEAAAGRS